MMTPTTAELVIWLRNMAIGLRASGEPTHDNDKGFDFAADRLSQLEGEVGRLREALRNLCATLDRLGDNGVYVIDTGLAHAYAASLAALEHQQKGEKL